MNGLDILIAAVLIISVITGLFQGIIRAVLSLAGLVFGGILGLKYSEALSAKLTFISNENVAHIAAFVFIFMAVIIAASIVAGIVKGIVHGLGAGWLDRLGGAVFGLVAGSAFWGAVLSWLVANPSLGMESIIEKSAMAVFLLNWYHWLFGVLPPGSVV